MTSPGARVPDDTVAVPITVKVVEELVACPTVRLVAEKSIVVAPALYNSIPLGVVPELVSTYWLIINCEKEAVVMNMTRASVSNFLIES